jgi:hypothetical protein
MRRLVGSMLIGALAVALSSGMARSSLPSTASYDLSSQILMRLFGETSDARLSVAAAYGNWAGESPLRNLALEIRPVSLPAVFGSELAEVPTFAQGSAGVNRAPGDYADLAAGAQAKLLHSDVLFAAPAAAPDNAPASVANVTRYPNITVAAYQPVASATDAPLTAGTANFGPLVGRDAYDQNAPSAVAGSLAGASGSSARLPASMQVGPVRFHGSVEGASAQVPQIALDDSAYGAGANFAVRAGRRKLNLAVSSSYEQLTRRDAALATSSVDAAWNLPGDNAPVIIPNSASMSRLSLGAGVAVPLITGLTLNVNYDTARLLGSYGLPGLTNLDAIDNAYGGGLTFAIPHSAGTLSLSAYQYRYQDNILPANSQNQTRENLSFTVKF